jgi:hypothetical protein
MNYDAIEIDERNVIPHIDIEKDIEKKQNGLFTFILRLDEGKITDYNVMEYGNFSKYLRFKQVTLTELTISRNSELGDKGATIRTDNG